jgi:hypothetical protein
MNSVISQVASVAIAPHRNVPGGEDKPSYRIKGDDPECRRMSGKFPDAGQAMAYSGEHWS